MEAQKKAEREQQQQQRAREEERRRAEAAERAAALSEAKTRVAAKEKERVAVAKAGRQRKASPSRAGAGVSTDSAISAYIARSNIVLDATAADGAAGNDDDVAAAVRAPHELAAVRDIVVDNPSPSPSQDKEER